MSYTDVSGCEYFELWGQPIVIEWKRKNFPEREPYYSVKQEFLMPDTEHPLDIIEWMQIQLALSGVLYVLGFEIEVAMPNDSVIYWSSKELPWE